MSSQIEATLGAQDLEKVRGSEPQVPTPQRKMKLDYVLCGRTTSGQESMDGEPVAAEKTVKTLFKWQDC